MKICKFFGIEMNFANKTIVQSIAVYVIFTIFKHFFINKLPKNLQ